MEKSLRLVGSHPEQNGQTYGQTVADFHSNEVEKIHNKPKCKNLRVVLDLKMREF